MTGGAEKEYLRVSHRLNLQLIVVQSACDFGESKISRALEHISDRAAPVRAAYLGEYVWMLLQEDADGPFARDICRVWARRDAKFANLQAPGERELPGQFMKTSESLVPVAQNDLAERRGRDALTIE